MSHVPASLTRRVALLVGFLSLVLFTAGCVSKQKVTKGALAQVDRSRIAVSATAGAVATLTERVVLRNDGDAPLDWTLTPDAAWLRVVPANGSVGSKQERGIDITVDPTDLEGGVYEATVVVQTNERKAQRITITVVFTWNRPSVPVPVFTRQPADALVADGASATFAALASASGARIAYRWERGEGTTWIPVSGASLPDLGLVATLADHDSRWRCIAETLGGSATSSEAVLRVLAAAPSITRHPSNATVEEGVPVRLSASAAGSAVLGWAWQRSGDGVTWAPVPGAVAADLDLASPALAENGARFRAVVANGAGSATSAAARLTVVPRVLAPSILVDPVATSAPEGDVGEFSATATGSAPLAWSWERSQDGNPPWTAVAGGTGPDLAVAAESANNGAFYRVRVANARGSVVSAAAEFQVLAVAPAFTRQPLPAGAVAGGTARFSAAATGSALVWAWERSSDGGATWAAVPGATADLLDLVGVALADDGLFVRAVVTGSAGSATSDAVRLSVSAGAVAPVITTAPADAVVADGSTTAFTVVATGTAPLVYQWQRSDDAGVTWADAGSGLPTLSFTVSLADQGARFRCRVTNSAGAVTSAAAVLTVTAVSPSIITDPLDQWVAVGGSATFTVTTAGTVTSVLWQQSLDGGATWSDLSVTGTTLVRSSLTLGANGRRYRARVGGPGGTVWSASALLTVTPSLVAPSIVTDPLDQNAADGATAAFTVVAQGTTPLQVQWQRSADGGATWSDEFGAIQSTLVVDGSLGANQHRFRAVVTNSAGSATSAAAVLTVTVVAPVIVTQPANQSHAVGGTAAFTVVAGGSAGSYQWQRSTDSGATWNDESGATSATLTLGNVQLSTNGHRFRCVVTNGGGTVISISVTLTVTISPTLPSITATPADQVIADGATTSFTVAVTGTSPIIYQWQRSTDGGTTWTDESGATLPTLTVTGSLSQSGHRFRCVITNTVGVVITVPVTLTVTVVAPVIVTQPSNQSHTVGGTAAFTVVTGGSAGSYQWQRSTDGGATWTDESGATSATLTLANVQLSSTGHRFRCVVTNGGGTVISISVTLTVTVAATLPSITATPADQVIADGATTSFSVAVTGTSPIIYQWQRSTDGGTSWTDESGATLPTLTVTGSLSQSGHRFRCVITNTVGVVITMPVTLTVTVVAPVIVTQPSNQSHAVSGTAAFAVVAGGSAGTYQWQRSTDGGATWTDESGATLATLTLGNVQLSSHGHRFRCVVTNGGGTVISISVTLTVTVAATLPSITATPADQVIADGATTSFSVAVTGTSPIVYQWQRSTDGGATWTDESGATLPTLTVTGSLAQSGHRFRCVITNTVGVIISVPVTLTVTVVAPVIVTQPANQSQAVGGTAAFAVVAGGSAGTYQWQRSTDGGGTWTDESGATSATLTLANVQLSSTGHRFRCVVTNGGGTVISISVSLTVTISATLPVITATPTSQVVADGATTSFTVVVTGTSPIIYQWQRSTDGGASWGDVAGATLPTLTVTGSLAQNGHRFRCVITNIVGVVITPGVTLTVTVAAPVITAQPVDVATAVGATATVGVTAVGPGTLAYQWQGSTDGGATWFTITGAVSPTYLRVLQAGDDGLRLRCRVGNAGGTVFSVSVRVTLIGNAPVVLTNPVDVSATAGGMATFAVTVGGAVPLAVTWQRSSDAGATWSGAGSGLSLVLSPVTGADDGHRFRAVVSNGFGSATSASARLSVTASSYRWIGSAGDGLWSTAANWSGTVVPPAGAPVIISGASVILPGGGTAGIGSLTATASTTLTGGTLRLAANGVLAVASGATLAVWAPLQASGWYQTDAGAVLLGGANSLGGTIEVQQGRLSASHAQALTGAAALVVADGAQTEVVIAPSSAPAATVAGVGPDGRGALVVGGGWPGAITADGPAMIGLDAGAANLAGTITGGAQTVTLRVAAGAVLTITGSVVSGDLVSTGPGRVVVAGSGSPTLGSTQVDGGRLDVQSVLGSSSTVSVSAGGTLGGTGVVGAPVRVTGTIDPGATP